jgi:hypothetical protein
MTYQPSGFRDDIGTEDCQPDYYEGSGVDLHLIGHDDWLLIATTTDDPRPWVVSTEMWADHGDNGGSDWPVVYRAVARMSPAEWAGLGWYRYSDADWPPLTPSALRELTARRAAAERDARRAPPGREAGQ